MARLLLEACKQVLPVLVLFQISKTGFTGKIVGQDCVYMNTIRKQSQSPCGSQATFFKAHAYFQTNSRFFLELVLNMVSRNV